MNIMTVDEKILSEPTDLFLQLELKESMIQDLNRETKEIQALLTEAVSDSTRLFNENKKLRAEIGETNLRANIAEEKLASIKEGSSVKISGKSQSMLRAELEQARATLVKVEQTLSDLILLTSGLLATDTKNDRPFSPTLNLIESTIESIDQAINETNG